MQVIFYSMYGHVYKMAEAVAEGTRQVADAAEVSLYQVPELVSDDILDKYGAKAAKAEFAKVPAANVEQLSDAHAVIFGTSTRFGNMAAQMRNFLDQALRGVNSGVVSPDERCHPVSHSEGVLRRRGAQESWLPATYLAAPEGSQSSGRLPIPDH